MNASFLAFMLLATAPPTSALGDVRAVSPPTIRVLQDELELWIHARGTVGPISVGSVWLDGVEITLDVDVDLGTEEHTDTDMDGTYESAWVSAHVDLLDVELAAGQLLEFEVVAPTADGDVLYRAVSRVESNVSVSMPQTLALTQEVLPVTIEWSELDLNLTALLVRVDGYDVTSLVSITGPVVLWNDVDGDWVNSRVEQYEIDLSVLAPYVVDGMTATVEAYASNFSDELSSSSASATLGPPAGPNACRDAAIQKFLDDLIVDKAADGTVTVSATPGVQRKLINDFQKALADCDPPVTNISDLTYTYSRPNKPTLKVKITVRSGNATCSGSADVVIAVGGDGPTPGNGAGGNASASNDQPGGAAIAGGGDGGSGGTTGGKGGSATASARSGGSGAPAGSASATGGQGGSPSNPGNAGGAGGSASSSVTPAGVGSSSSSSGGSGGAGVHGGGAYSQSNGGSSSAGQFSPPTGNSAN